LYLKRLFQLETRLPYLLFLAAELNYANEARTKAPVKGSRYLLDRGHDHSGRQR